MLQAVERDDLQGALAGVRAQVAFVESLVRGEAGEGNTGNDNGVRAGLASASPAPALI